MVARKSTSSLLIGWFVTTAVLASAILSSGRAAADVPAENRALVIVTDLDTHGFPALAPLYSTLESLGAGIPRLPIIRGAYREIHTLRDSSATLASWRTMIYGLAARKEIQAIDTILMLHGLPNELAFFDDSYSMTDVAQALTRDLAPGDRLRRKMAEKKLRLLYNTSCFGSSHRNEFMSVGFATVIGSVGVNANSELEFPQFIAAWVAGQTVAVALAPSNTPVALALTDSAIRDLGIRMDNILQQTNSEKRVSGLSQLTINTDVR